MKRQFKVVLDLKTEPSQVFAAINQGGYNVFQEISATDKNPYEVIWSSRLKKGAVHFIADDLVNIDYLIFDEIPFLECRGIFEKFEVYHLQDLLELQINESVVTDLFIVGGVSILGTREMLFVISERLWAFAKSDVSRLRLAVISASLYLAWAELLPVLQYIADNDSEDFVKWRARQVIDTLEE